MQNIVQLKREHYLSCARDMDLDIEVIMAVAEIESAGSGFIQNSDLPKILFEGHHFHKFTNGRYARDFPALSYPSWTTRYYKGGRGEYDRLLEAIKVHDRNPEPALLATSWGKFQIMGFNFKAAGYSSVFDFVNSMAVSEEAQLRAFVSFVKAKGLLDELREQRWADFARSYNGKMFAKHGYDRKLAAEFARKRMKLQEEDQGAGFATERGDLMAIQTALNAALAAQLPEPLTVDGWIGEKTRRAIRLFKKNNGMPEDDRITKELGDALEVDLMAYVES